MKFLIQQKQRETVHHFSRIPRTIRGEEIKELRNDENGNESKKIEKMERVEGKTGKKPPCKFVVSKPC